MDTSDSIISVAVGISKLTAAIMFTVVSLLIVITCFLVVYTVTNIPTMNTNFCDLSDDVYQAITENAEQWVDYFVANAARDFYQYPQFRVSGEVIQYGVSPDWIEAENDVLILYISTYPGWPNTPEGSKGYIYSPSGKVPTGYWTQNYSIQRLEGNIFCYSKQKHF